MVLANCYTESFMIRTKSENFFYYWNTNVSETSDLLIVNYRNNAKYSYRLNQHMLCYVTTCYLWTQFGRMALFSWMEFVAVLTSVGCLIYEQKCLAVKQNHVRLANTFYKFSLCRRSKSSPARTCAEPRCSTGGNNNNGNNNHNHNNKAHNNNINHNNDNNNNINHISNNNIWDTIKGNKT